jgi:hypothetical protein
MRWGDGFTAASAGAVSAATPPALMTATSTAAVMRFMVFSGFRRDTVS